MMLNQHNEIHKDFQAAAKKCKSLEDVKKLRIRFLGKSGVVKQEFKELKVLCNEVRAIDKSLEEVETMSNNFMTDVEIVRKEIAILFDYNL